jgi:peptidoglycan/LPS O-acetylase OafA/YrhL
MSTTAARSLLAVGLLAVYLFFTLSGFLITHLLLEERATSGRISLKRFYLRRSLRILPMYVAYVAFIIVLGAVGVIDLPLSATVQALTFTRNYFVSSALAFGILWSLCVEEQFYVLWPQVLARVSTRTATKIVCIAIGLAPVVRLGTYWIDYRVLDFPTTPSLWLTGVVELLAVGVLLALDEGGGAFASVFDWLSSAWGIGCSIFLVVCVYLSPGGQGTFEPIGFGTIFLPTACALLTVGLVDRYRRGRNFPVTRLLNMRVPVWLGNLSYSLYLFHVPLVSRHETRITTPFPLSVVLALLLAWIVDRCIGRPMLRLKDSLPSYGLVPNVKADDRPTSTRQLPEDKSA